MILFAVCPDDADSLTMARDWIAAHGIQPTEARLVKRDGMIVVIDRGETWRRLKPIS